MRIRSQFAILLLGILVVPVLIGASLFLVGFLRDAQSIEVPSPAEVLESTGRAVDPESWAEVEAFLSRRSSYLAHLVLDKSGLVLYASIEGFVPGTRLDDAALGAYIARGSTRFFYQIETPRPHLEHYTVLTRFDREQKRFPSFYRFLASSFLALLGGLFLFSALVSISIARSIARSVSLLEQHTRRIADGELDLALEVKGSNEITSLVTSLNHLRLSLKEERARRARFIMGVSHDLKTPLALIKGYAEAIEDGVADNPAERLHSLKIIGAKVDQLEGMIDDLIGYVRMDSSGWRHQLLPQALAPFLRDFCQRFSTDAVLLERVFSYDIGLPDELLVPFDERLVTRALENLCANALRYTAKGGTIRFEAQLRKGGLVGLGPSGDSPCWGRVEMSLCDDGIGMSAEDLPHIFDPFWRASPSRREGGMGLGLAIVRSVVDSHDWTIAVQSEPGRGTCFTLGLACSRPSSVPD